MPFENHPAVDFFNTQAHEITKKVYLSILDRYASLSHFSLQILGEIQGRHLGALPIGAGSSVDRPLKRKKVLLTAGFHGGEPAGVYALIEFLEQHPFLLKDFDIEVLPCVNPYGFITHERHGSTHQDLNRVMEENSIAPEVRLILKHLKQSPQSKYDVVVDLHEDNPDHLCDFAPNAPSPKEFYLYESASSDTQRIAQKIIDAVRSANFSVCAWDSIYGAPASGGIIKKTTALRTSLASFDEYLTPHRTELFLTHETPAAGRLEYRIKTHTVALTAVFAALSP